MIIDVAFQHRPIRREGDRTDLRTPRPTTSVVSDADLDAVFVDVDNTLVKGSVLFHVGRGLVASGLVSGTQLARVATWHALYRLFGEGPRLVATAQRHGLALADGLPVREIVDSLDHLYDTYIAPRLWGGTVRMLEAHRSAGTPVWLATAAPMALASLIARRLGLSGAVGTRVEDLRGVYTGKLDGPVLHGPAKATAVIDLAVSHAWRLDRCTAYSDSTADLPLLYAVGHPAAINPDGALKHIAAARGWPVHDFRARAHVMHASGSVRSGSFAGSRSSTGRTPPAPRRGWPAATPVSR